MTRDLTADERQRADFWFCFFVGDGWDALESFVVQKNIVVTLS